MRVKIIFFPLKAFFSFPFEEGSSINPWNAGPKVVLCVPSNGKGRVGHVQIVCGALCSEEARLSETPPPAAALDVAHADAWVSSRRLRGRCVSNW